MAQLKDSLITGSLRVTDTIFSNNLNLSSLTANYAVLTDANKNLVSRNITNNTSATAVAASTNLITANTLYYHKGNSNIVTVGTISSGTWQGTTIGTAYGGTGNTSFTQWGIIYANPATKLVSTAAGTSGYLLQGNGSAAPSWIQATNANTASTIVKRDASGNFSAGTITAALSGNATTATTASYLEAPNEYGYYTDEYGNLIYKYVPDPDNPATGYFHLDNNAKTISLKYYWDSGDVWVPGKVGIGYNPTTSGNTYSLYVNGTSYFNGGVSVPSTLVVRAENTTTEGGQICLNADPNHSAYNAYLDVCDNNFRIHSNGQENFKVNLSSGNMTARGNLTLTNGGIFRIDHTGQGAKTKGTAYGAFYITFKNSTNDKAYAVTPIRYVGTDGTDQYNTCVILGSDNGTTWIGAGESSNYLPGKIAYNDENLYLSADGSVQIYTSGSNDGSSYSGPVTISGTTITANLTGNVTGNCSGSSGSCTGLAAKATADADNNTISSTYLKKSGGTMTGALTFANNTWNTMGDDCYIGDKDIAGAICIKGITGNTKLRFIQKDGTASKDITFDGTTLTVNGGIKVQSYFHITANAGAQSLLMGNQDSAGANSPVVFQAANGTLSIGVGNNWSSNTGGTLTTTLFLSKDNKVGIGTTSPSTKLHVNGALTLNGDLKLYTSSADSPDITWWYADGAKEQARIWMGDGGTTKWAPYYRCYDSSGTQLYNGKLVLGDGTGASGSWGISITGNAASATYASSYLANRGDVGGDTHAAALQSWFNSNKSTEPRNALVAHYSSAYGNGSLCMGYFLNGYDSGPYGGFFVAHYNSAYYVGIQSGTYTQKQLVTNGGSWDLSVTNASYLAAPHAAGVTTDEYGNFKHKRSTNTDYWSLLSNGGTAKFQFYLETGNATFTQDLTCRQIYLNAYGGAWGTGGQACFWYNGDSGVTASGESASRARVDKAFQATKVYNAVWNDYAECRQVETEEPGYCVTESSSGVMIKTTERLQAGCKITSDTFGTCMGETSTARTPIAVAGRVLVYPYRDRKEYELGAAVCSAPNGTIDIMTRNEIMMYPERIIGTVSEIPSYEIWHCGEHEKEEIKVNGRIWIYVR